MGEPNSHPPPWIQYITGRFDEVVAYQELQSVHLRAQKEALLNAVRTLVGVQTLT